MATNKSVVVLTPNGRRQTVKVSPNTTILQILEEVCKKQGFDPDKYDVKHHNKVLDVSSILRFTGLPNNAQLEMCELLKARAQNPVILGIQLENGERLTGNFLPTENLLNVLNQMCPNELEADKTPVIIYMRQEIHRENLETTTLKSLGLTGGRAMLRLIHRTPEELKTQANVSVLLPSKPTEEKPYYKKPKSLSSLYGSPTPSTSSQDENKNNQTSNSSHHGKKENFLSNFLKQENAKKESETTKQPKNKPNETEPMEVDDPKHTQLVEKIENKTEDISEFTFLGERNALAFSLDSTETVPHEDLPDEFFELTMQDAKKLLRDLKNKRIQLEENPLQTSTLRNLEESKKILRTLNQYTRTIIRVQFPDRTVLQGTFKPIETIGDVMNFVKKYLENPNNEFHLYTTPPKHILQSEQSLLDIYCVPSAVLHFGVTTPVTEQDKFLCHSLYVSFTTPSAAIVAATKSRGKERKLVSNDIQSDDIDLNEVPKPTESVAYDSEPSTSKGITKSSDAPNKKIPKWFKPNK